MLDVIRVLPILLLPAALAVGAPAAAAPPEATEAPDEAETETDSDAEEFVPMRDDPRAVAARRWRNTGVGLMIVGTLVGGGALAIGFADPCRPQPGNDCRLDDRRRAAIAVGVPAAVIFTGGLVSFGVGQSRLRTLQLSFSARRSGAWLALGGRF